MTEISCERLEKCVEIANCESVLQVWLANKEKTEYSEALKTLTCGFNGKTPKVCCPINQE